MMNKLLHSRQAYMDGACTLDQFYGQFITPQLLHMVKTSIMPAVIKAGGMENLDNAFWDAYSNLTKSYVVKDLLRQAFPSPREGFAYGWSLNTNICILKTAVRRLDACPDL